MRLTLAHSGSEGCEKVWPCAIEWRTLGEWGRGRGVGWVSNDSRRGWVSNVKI
jgi:hypothetical protein